MRIKSLACGLALCALAATASAQYTIVLRDGARVKATAAPKFKDGKAFFTTWTGKTYTFVKEADVDKPATEMANAAIESTDIAGRPTPAGRSLRGRPLAVSKDQLDKRMKDLEEGRQGGGGGALMTTTSPEGESEPPAPGMTNRINRQAERGTQVGTDVPLVEDGEGVDATSSEQAADKVKNLEERQAEGPDVGAAAARVEAAARQVDDLRQQKKGNEERIQALQQQQEAARSEGSGVKESALQSQIDQLSAGQAELDRRIADAEADRTAAEKPEKN